MKMGVMERLHMGHRQQIKKRILMVDDEVRYTRLVKMNLEADGRFEVRTENSPLNALVAAREFSPDLIILDVMMPDGDGGQIAARLRQDTRFQDIPIIFVTAAVKGSEVKAGSGWIGGLFYVPKPVTADALIGHIETFLRV